MTSTGTSKPKILVTDKVMFELNREALRFPGHENSVGIVGLQYLDGTIAITGVIPPPAMDVVRNIATAQLGGRDLKAASDWLKANFAALNTKSEVKFLFLGKAHSHQTLGFIRFSSVDNMSILEAVRDYNSEVAVWPLLLISEFQSRVRTLGQMDGTLSVESDTTVRVRFYYLDRKMVKAGITEPVLIQPKVIKANGVPVVLPNLPWRHVDEDRYRRQIRQLEEYGAETIVFTRNVDKDPEYELQFVIKHPTKWRGTLIITTDWNFPESPPVVQVASSEGLMTITNDTDGQPIWTHGNDFLEIAFELEKLEEL